jgi:group II intron reverse transcriptase/maturase/CRISPR-associated endonuclease Cas1
MPFVVPFARYRIELRLLHSARLHFRHEVMLHSLLSEALGRGELPDTVIPFACESGRVDFERDDAYRIGFTIAGKNGDDFAEHLSRALAVYGARGFQGERIPMLRWFSAGRPEQLSPPGLDAECAALAGRDQIEIRFVSPLRLEIPRAARREDSQFFDAGHFPADDFFRLLWNRIFFLSEGRFPHRDEAERGMPPVPELDCDPCRLLWVDVPRMKKPPLGGVVGQLVIRNPGEPWLPLLVAGQYLHVGKSCGYGFGGYRIMNGQPLCNDAFGPSRTALERVAERDRLIAAASHVASATEAGGTDDIGPKEFVSREEEIVSGLIRGLADGSYKPAPLLGILLPKGHHKVRALAVPTLIDRAVQRSALEVIGPAIETLLEDCSYAYRKGFSRAGAARAVEKAYADGYRWVLDADIDSFFDAVDWERLFGKVEALYPFDPIVALMRQWVTAPVIFEGKRILRLRGLPQGAVISPLLANLFLDELDEELLSEDFRLVRYADDFVVLCKDMAAAERAREEARAVLDHLGLALQEEKTSIRSADHGFSYLGYLFCRSVTVEQHREETKAEADASLVVSPSSWLAQVDLSRVRELGVAATSTSELPKVAPLLDGAASAGADARRPLYVIDPAVCLHLREGTVVVEKEGDPPKRVPLRALSHVVFIGSRRATLPLILELGLAGVPSFFCRRNGELEAIHSPFEPDVGVWMAQGKAAGEESIRLAFAQEIVAAKLHNYAALAVRHALHDGDAAAGEIRELERSVWNKTEVDSVRGVEGAAAVIYFRSVAATLADEWSFDGRVKHPPRDPFNALLSYGYTLLYHHCTTALYAAGLMPRIGLYHRQHGSWQALASDLQEELRYVVDGVVWSLVRRREIGPDDFERSSGGCWLLPEPRRRFIEAFEGRMETDFTPHGEDRALTYREAIGVQAVRLRDYVLGRSRYEAIRAHG